jgi:hypothetical protein
VSQFSHGSFRMPSPFDLQETTMSNVGRRDFKSAKSHAKASAAKAKSDLSRRKPKTQGAAKAPGKRRLGKPS